MTDAADRLARVVELCERANSTQWFPEWMEASRDAEREAFAFLRGDAPALLAEFQALRSENDLTLAAHCKQGDELFAMRERLRVAMETKADYDKLRAELRSCSLRLRALREALPRSYVEIEETFLATHVAGAGEGNG